MTLVKKVLPVSLLAIGLYYMVLILYFRPAQMQAVSWSAGSSTTVHVNTAYLETLRENAGYAEFGGTSLKPLTGYKFREVKGGPEGPQPQLPDGKILKIYVAEKIGEKIVEARDQFGNVLARVTWSQFKVVDLFDDWAGKPVAWTEKIDVLSSYGGNGLGLWIWKVAERMFATPGTTKIVLDMSRTSTGATDWTSRYLPVLLQFMQEIGRNPTIEQCWTDLKIWLIQY